MFLCILSLFTFMVFCVQVSSSPSGYVTVYSGTKFYSVNGVLTFPSTYQFDIAKATASQLEFNATNTVSGFANNQFICNLANVTSDTNPKIIIITRNTKPTYILNVKNYSYSTDRTTFYGLSDSKTVTVDFGTLYGGGFKIIQAPTLTSPPSFSDNKFTFTITATGTSITRVECPSKPEQVNVNGKSYGEGSVWTYNSNILTLTWTHASDANIELLTKPLTSSFTYVRQVWGGMFIIIVLVVSVSLISALLKEEIDLRQFTWGIIGLTVSTAFLMILLQVVEGL